MKLIQQEFSVPFQYTVHFTADIFSTKNLLFASSVSDGRPAKLFFVIDQGVSLAHPSLLDKIKHYAETFHEQIHLCADPLVVPGGERVKNDHHFLEKVIEATNTYGIDRHSFIVAIGGGAVLDMAGFAAAISHRGIRHIRIPTTVLAQNDSGIGVKNSVNAFKKKNFLGTFAPPFAVLNDSCFLSTLSDRDWRSGISEAIKVALIKDESFFEWIEVSATELVNRDLPSMEVLIYRCAKLHLDHISGGDPFESGSSRPLDFGHWAAHKLEYLTNYEIRHGEAVAIGICLDVTYSFLDGLLSLGEYSRIIRLFQKLEFPVYISELSGENIINGLEEFREHLGGELTVTLISGIGQGIEVHQMNAQLILDAGEKLRELQGEEFRFRT